MRRYITILYIALLAASPLAAQTIDDVHVVGGKANADGTVTYELTYTMPLPQPRSDYSYTVTPIIRHGADSITDTPVMIRGKRNAKKFRRDILFSRNPKLDPALTYIPAGTKTAVTRTLTLNSAEHPWLKGNDITLCTQIDEEGCCEILGTRWQCGETAHCERPFAPVIADVEDNTGKAGMLEKDNPILQHVSHYRPYDDSRILRKESGMLYVFFPLDKWTLLHDFRNNAATLDTIVSITRQIMADTTSTVKLIQIIGLASPEGPVKRNLLLGENRAIALRDYVQTHVDTPMPDSMFELCNGGEAWNELRSQVEELDIEGRDQLLDIIDNTPDPDLRERRMKALNGGKTYAYLKDNVLRDQRNSGYIRIYYDYVPDTAAATINRASELLREEKYAEALELLNTVKDDHRSLNARGVALYMTGSHEEGIAAIRRAAALGNEQAKNNLKQLTE